VIVVCDMGPLHYLVLMEVEHILPQLFTRVLAPPVVLVEMSRAEAPAPVRRWAGCPPQWLEVKQPVHVEDIPALGRKGTRGDGDRAVISLAREEGADFVVMDDMRARREAKNRGCEPLWMLQVLDEAAERGFINDVSQKLDHLQHKTNFYVGDKVRAVIGDIKQRDLHREQARESAVPTSEDDEKKETGE
jgi:predicted nucleic acid-binding protein